MGNIWGWVGGISGLCLSFWTVRLVSGGIWETGVLFIIVGEGICDFGVLSIMVGEDCGSSFCSSFAYGLLSDSICLISGCCILSVVCRCRDGWSLWITFLSVSKIWTTLWSCFFVLEHLYTLPVWHFISPIFRVGLCTPQNSRCLFTYTFIYFSSVSRRTLKKDTKMIEACLWMGLQSALKYMVLFLDRLYDIFSVQKWWFKFLLYVMSNACICCASSLTPDAILPGLIVCKSGVSKRFFAFPESQG